MVAGGVVGVPGLPQLSPATPKNPPPLITSLLLFCSSRDGSNQYRFWTAKGKPTFAWEAGWKEPYWY